MTAWHGAESEIIRAEPEVSSGDTMIAAPRAVNVDELRFSSS